MTDEENLKRWIFRYEFLEAWLIKAMGIEPEEAKKLIQSECEEAMRKKGFDYLT